MKTLSILKLKPVIDIDLSWADFLSAFYGLFRFESEEINWPRPDSLSYFSARSGFHHLLSILNFPKGAEVILGAVTIPGMVKIIEYHGLVPKFVDIDQLDYKLNADQIKRLLNDKVKMILVTQLFGSRFTLADIAKATEGKNIFLTEDCAQAFDGSYKGSSFADATLFSFGPIKKHTCLSGAKLTVKQEKLKNLLSETLTNLPKASNRWLVSRIIKYAILKFICCAPLYGFLNLVANRLCLNLDEILYNFSRSFRTKPIEKQLDYQLALLARSFLNKRLSAFNIEKAKKGMKPWVRTLRTHSPEIFVKKCHARGIPASAQLGSVACLAPKGQCPNAEQLLKRIVFVRGD